jgi:hypothetical protein
MKTKKSYLFLDNDVYSPEEVTGTFGKEVAIDKKNGDEVYFTFIKTGKKGYVVYPDLFAENTPENQAIITKLIKIRKDVETMKKSANELYDTIQPAKF